MKNFIEGVDEFMAEAISVGEAFLKGYISGSTLKFLDPENKGDVERSFEIFKTYDSGNVSPLRERAFKHGYDFGQKEGLVTATEKDLCKHCGKRHL